MPSVLSRATRPALLLAALSATACGSVEENLIAQGHPAAYARGYADGCASGKEAAGGLFAQGRKDASRYGGGGGDRGRAATGGRSQN